MLLMLASGASFCQQNPLESGRNAERMELYESAQAYYQQAIDAAPESAEPHMAMGLLMERRLRPQQAIEHYRAAIALDDTLAAAYEHLAYCLLETDDYDCLPVIERAIELNPNSASAYCSMALYVCHQKNYTNALTWARKALAADPKSPRAYRWL